MKTKLLAAVSDPHCGSEVGLCPKEVRLAHGNIVTLGDNEHQKWLLGNWEDHRGKIKKICGKDRPALVINGDVIEGRHHGNKDVIAETNEIHLEAAIDVFQPLLAICSKCYVTAGTAAHTERLEDIFAQRIKAVGREAKNMWQIEINGCLIQVKHHMSTTSRAYLEAGAMSAHLNNVRINYLRNGWRVPSVVLRAHRHCGGTYSDGFGLFGVTGAWQFLTRHGHKVVPDSIPQPTTLLLDWRDVPPGKLPRVHEFKSSPPQPSISSI